MRIVVGTDGSGGGRAALAWALGLVRGRHDASDVIELVNVYGGHHLAMPLFVPTSVTPPGRYLTDHPGAGVALEAESVTHRAELQDHLRYEAEQLLADLVREVDGTGGVRIETVAVPGEEAGRALVAHAEGADLLVVGARGGRPLHRLLGSVSEHCVNHAHGPVVVIR
ncbi:MAG TPA: universal stress protein [Acidimicrobiales bacterium]|nr:universal stress protein [Acidimicrobiales bacterium]